RFAEREQVNSMTTTTKDALSPAARIAEVATTLGACDHDRHPRGIVHCPLCGQASLHVQVTREDAVLIECGPAPWVTRATCGTWSAARAILPHLTAAGIDPAPMWSAIESWERRQGGTMPSLPFRTARDFALDTPPVMLMAVDGLIAHGALTELIAAPKA